MGLLGMGRQASLQIKAKLWMEAAAGHERGRGHDEGVA